MTGKTSLTCDESDDIDRLVNIPLPDGDEIELSWIVTQTGEK